MATQTWITGTIGNWFTPANWDSGTVPSTGDSVAIKAGQPTIEAGAPAIVGEAIVLGGVELASPVTLEAIDATFKGDTSGTPEVNTTITVTGGHPGSSPLDATFLVEGNTSFDGQILVEAVGGSLTIDSESDGTNPGHFSFLNTDQKAVMLVTQESVLVFKGQTITNDGLIEVDGGVDIAAGVSFGGAGHIALEDGGQLAVEGSVGAGQQVDFADGSGSAVLSNAAGFSGVFGFTTVGGNRIDLAGLQAHSEKFVPGDATHPGVLDLYASSDQTGTPLAQLSMQLIDGGDLEPLSHDKQTLTTADFAIASDGKGGTRVTYTPQGPVYLDQSLPVPIAAAAGTMVSLATILQQSFGTATPGFYSLTLLPTKAWDNTSTDVGYWSTPDVTPAWFVNGTEITAPTVVQAGDDVELQVGNQIIDPAQFQAQVTASATGTGAEYVTYDAWSVDPAIIQAVQAAGHAGLPTPGAVVASANAFNATFGQVLNTNLCNWIADNVAAGAGASMPLPNAMLDPTLNVSGGFWRIAYTGTGPSPVANWSKLVKPGDIVRMGWFKPESGVESGHSTTVLGLVQPDGKIAFYDNVDFVDDVEYIGIHDSSYWTASDPADITIYRLDPNQQYLIEGSSLAEVIQGSVYNNLIQPGGGADVITAGAGTNEIQDTTAHLDGITVTDFHVGDSLDFTDLDRSQATVSYSAGALHVFDDNTQVATIAMPAPTPGEAFVLSWDGHDGSLVSLRDAVTLRRSFPAGYALDPAVQTLSLAATATVGGTGVTTTPSHPTTVNNQGRIAATATGLSLPGGGTVINGNRGNAAALISGSTGIVLKGAGTVTNFGTIAGTGGTAISFNSSSARLVEQGSGDLDGAVLGGGGTLELAGQGGAGTFDGLGSIVKGFAAVTVDRLSTWSLSGASIVAKNTLLDNSGTLDLLGPLANNGRVNNLAGGKLMLEGDFGIGNTGEFFNAGLLEKVAGTGTSLIRTGTAELNNTGTIDVETGTLELTGAKIGISGRIQGAGAIEFGPGAITLYAGTIITTARLAIAGTDARILLAHSLGYAGTFSAGTGTELTIDTGDFLKLMGPASFFRDTVDGAGRLMTTGSTSVAVVTLGGTAQWYNAGTLTETAAFTIGGSLGNKATFVNQAAGVFNLAGNVGIAIGTASTSTFANQGLLAKTAGGTSTIGIAVANTGTIESASGTLDLQQAVTGNGGILKIDAGRAIQADAAVSAGQTVDFNGGGDKLVLTDAAHFAAKLSDFGAGDKLDLRQFDPASTTLAYVENAGHTAGMLTVTDGALQAKIALLGDYTAAAFHAASDGVAGGTYITYTPPASSMLLAAPHT